MTTNSLSWMVGGPQGSGVDSAARLFAIAAARAGLHVVGQREYYSNIMGEHSYYKIRVSEKVIRSPRAHIEVLASYEEETMVRHLHSQELVPGGAVIYDPETVKHEVDDIEFMDARVKHDVGTWLSEHGQPNTVGGVVEMEKKRGVRAIPLPYKAVMDAVGKKMGITEFSKLSLLRNTIAVGASFGILHMEPEILDETIRATFESKGPKVIEMNTLAATLASEQAREQVPDFQFKLKKVGSAGDKLWLQGTHAVALGKIAAGCRFQTYYPISPATDESVFLEANPDSNVVVVQTEDEIAAATMAVGAALTGARSSTSTSGPGFCLMVEALGYAGICEVPVVVVDYQRGGPSTGLPTRTEQGDLKFALSLGHGEFPRLVVTPGDVEEMFVDTIRAFNWAEQYQTPVILLPDKDLAGNSMTVDPLKVDGLLIDRGKFATPADVKAHGDNGRWRRYAFTDDGISPRTIIGTEGGIHWHTGDEHTELGHITEDPVLRERMMEKRMGKLALAAKQIPADQKFTLHGAKQADVTIVSWGGTKGPILDALPALKEKGVTANFLQIRLMLPFPVAETTPILKGAKKLMSLEQNYSGQLADLVREQTGVTIPHRVVKYNGRPVTQDEVVDAVDAVLKKGMERVVLRHGV